MTRQAIHAARRTKLDESIHPVWWTPVRTAVFGALIMRSEIKDRMQKQAHKPSSLWRCYVSPRTRYLFGIPGLEVITAANVGSATKSLSDWGYVEGLGTNTRRVDFTPKGWAYAAATGLIDPDWLEVIYHADLPSGHIAFTLYQQIKDGLKLSVDGLPGLPEFDYSTENAIGRWVKDDPHVSAVRFELAHDLHAAGAKALVKFEPHQIALALEDLLSSEEVLRADLELRRLNRMVWSESYYSRLLVKRMSSTGQFRAHTLADIADDQRDFGVKGVSRIAAALEAQQLTDEGLARHMPSNATLGEVHDRIEAEKAAGLHGVSNMTPVPATPEEIAASEVAAKDREPIVDFIERRMSQYNYDGWIPEGKAKLVAREAVLRSTRERINRFGFLDGHNEIPPEAGTPDGHYYSHEKVGELGVIKGSSGMVYHPLTALTLGTLGGLVALGGLLLAVHILPIG